MGAMDAYLERMRERGGPSHPVNRGVELGEHVVSLLCEIRDAVNRTDDPKAETLPPRGLGYLVQCDGTGAGVAELHARAGVTLQLLTFSWQNSGAAQGYLAVYLDSPNDPTRLFKAVMAPSIGDDHFGQGFYVPPHGALYIVANGLAANATIGGRIGAAPTIHGATENTREGDMTV